MTKRAFDKIKAGIEDAIAYAAGDDSRGAISYIPSSVDVRAIRKAHGLTQKDFAVRFGFTLSRLRDWEQGRSSPDSASRAFLMVIAQEYDAVERALKVA
ncbi:MAG: helix-turn-helix domain-containing protein [Bauldia sp.]|nr:helix-turn-helix domain-containing protein [Bauldia sp.]